jgi:hypothetical protein
VCLGLLRRGDALLRERGGIVYDSESLLCECVNPVGRGKGIGGLRVGILDEEKGMRRIHLRRFERGERG